MERLVIVQFILSLLIFFHQINELVEPLRDFFSCLFFASIGKFWFFKNIFFSFYSSTWKCREFSLTWQFSNTDKNQRFPKGSDGIVVRALPSNSCGPSSIPCWYSHMWVEFVVVGSRLAPKIFLKQEPYSW